LADKPRELTITALTDSTLLKLDKEHFITLIRNPSLTFINPTTISQELKNGSLLIDIRSPDDFQENHIDGSINMPYFSIRMTIKNLDRSRKIMILCDDGKLSEAAAFNLIREQFNVAIVEGGLEKYQHTDKHTTNFEIDDPALDDDIASEQDLSAQQIQTNVIEMPGVFETNSSPANKQNPESGFDNNTLIEAKIQLLKDENRALMRANMRLEIQYEELLKQKEMLELQLQTIQNKQG
jgi:rhodanese-related sulfurtransferase